MTSAVACAPRPLAASHGTALQAPLHWQLVEFISDLHLQASEAATFEAWRAYMQTSQADAIFILGDLFEVWVGDDVIQTAAAPLDPTIFVVRCAQILQAASQRLAIFFMHGNRDFLLGPDFAQASGMQLLDDPTVLLFGGQRWLLSHGDALCLSDTEYMKFRTQVRSPAWQADFLAKSLLERQAIARALRMQSEARKHSTQASDTAFADVDESMACEWLVATQATTLIHGHTHRPADHALPSNQRRIVLSDWDEAATPPRGEVLQLSAVNALKRIKT
jgi:UDP-2,3-diacylglucosamine hydrolase